jgi:hypothetical protein
MRRTEFAPAHYRASFHPALQAAALRDNSRRERGRAPQPFAADTGDLHEALWIGQVPPALPLNSRIAAAIAGVGLLAIVVLAALHHVYGL